MNAQAKLETEKLRAELTQRALEHEVKFRRVDEQVAERLSGVYQLLLASFQSVASYVAIFGGWRNARHVLARLAEHGDDALIRPLRDNAEHPAERRVAQGQTYHFLIERTDDRTLRWYVDGDLIHELADVAPLTGNGHDHFGFNDWAARICFDNLEVEAL